MLDWWVILTYKLQLMQTPSWEHALVSHKNCGLVKGEVVWMPYSEQHEWRRNKNNHHQRYKTCPAAVFDPPLQLPCLIWTPAHTEPHAQPRCSHTPRLATHRSHSKSHFPSAVGRSSKQICLFSLWRNGFILINEQWCYAVGAAQSMSASLF